MKVFRSILIIIAIFAIQPTFSQLADMTLLREMNRGNGGSLDAPTPEASAITDDENDIETDEIDFEDINYGYTGASDFTETPQKNISSEPLAYFGYDFFIKDYPVYNDMKSLPIPYNYVIGPNDNIKVIFFGNTNLTQNLKVTRDGDIFIPKIGPVSVVGLSFSQLSQKIEDIVFNQLTGTKVNITLGALRSIDIFVLGEAREPGMYTVTGLSSLTNAIFKSGGIETTGSLRNIQVKRKGKIVKVFDFYELLLNGDTSNDIRLLQGDVVFIPSKEKTIGISGEVARPGIYELKENEKLGDLIRYAGNLKPKASIKTAFLERIAKDLNGFTLVPLKSQNLDTFNLSNGDVIRMSPIVDNLQNAILLKGHIQKPGFHPWFEGMRISDLLKGPRDLLSMTDINYLLIQREDPINQKMDYLQADLETVFSNPDSIENIELKERDELLLLPSLLLANQITTTLVEDQYVLDEKTNQISLEENEWTSMTYLRKSLVEETEQLEIRDQYSSDPELARQELNTMKLSNRFYEYSINKYCSIPEDLVIKVITATGYQLEQTIPLDQLQNIKTAEALDALQRKIKEDTEREKDNEGEFVKNIPNIITDLCRNELLSDALDIIKRQTDPSNQEKTITVFGNIHFPGTYPLTKNMTLAAAIKAAGGFKQSTYESEIELSRSNNRGKKYSVSNSFLTLDSKAMDTALQGLDIINIKEISSEVQTVRIEGEVYFAGTYPISENQTLSEIIQRAGGITDYGDINATVFQRESIKEAEIERLRHAQDELKRKILLSSQAGGLGQESLDSKAIGQLTQLIVGSSDEEDAVGRLVVDLESILEGSIDDIFLEHNDSIYIPRTQQSVTVMGEVFVANSHLFKKDLTLEDYLQLSGGVNDYSDPDNTYLIKSNGRIISPSQISSGGFFRSSTSLIEPGDTIVVPLQVQPFSSIRATTEITQIIYQMALAAAAVNSF